MSSTALGCQKAQAQTLVCCRGTQDPLWAFSGPWVQSCGSDTFLMGSVLHETAFRNSWKCVRLAVFHPSYKSPVNGKGGFEEEKKKNPGSSRKLRSKLCSLAFLAGAPGVCNMSPGCQTAHIKSRGLGPNRAVWEQSRASEVHRTIGPECESARSAAKDLSRLTAT